MTPRTRVSPCCYGSWGHKLRIPASAEGAKRHNCQQERFDFYVQRDGLPAARAKMADIVRTYRKAVLDPTQYTMYRQKLICGYVCAKRLM